MADLSRLEFQRILIIKPSSFGDVIHALPVLNGLRKRYPTSRISWLVANACAGLLEGHGALDEVIPFDRKRYGQLGRSLQISVEFAEFVRALRRRAFDLVVDLQGLFRSGFLALASGAAVRIGFASAREFAPLFYSHRVAVRNPDMHAVDRNYLFAQRLGFADVPIRFELPVRADARSSAAALLAAGGLVPGEPFAIIAPGTRWETKMWPPESFAAVARGLTERFGLPVVLVGMESEVPVARCVTELAGGRIVNLAGQTRLPELIALVEQARVCVMHDSGPMHLATALAKPMVAIYGPTSPARTGPYGRSDAVARLDLDCSPCYLRRVEECPHEHRCMRTLTPQQILTKVAALMNPGACRIGT